MNNPTPEEQVLADLEAATTDEERRATEIRAIWSDNGPTAAPDGWTVKDYDPGDEAPEGSPEHDCDGEEHDGASQ